MNAMLGIDTDIAMALMYAACALACLTAGRIGFGDSNGRVTSRPWTFWNCTTILLLLLAFNAILQLDQEFVVWARNVAKSGGWYPWRRPLQIAVLSALACGAATLIALANQYNWHPHFSTSRAIAGCGLFILLTLLSFRFVSWHYTDQLLNSRLSNFRIGRLTELLGLVVVATGGTLHVIRGD
jgi:hypothetical protein